MASRRELKKNVKRQGSQQVNNAEETEYVFLRAWRAIYSCQILKGKESSEKVLHYDKWGSQIGGEPFQAFYND